MHPRDFALLDGPRWYQLPAEWGQLKRRYSGLGPSESLDWVYEHVEGLNATAALLEHEYLDRDYRNEYANFYVKTFRWVPDRCERLHFWCDDRYLGYCSIRPIQGRPVGRTMLDPGADLEDDVACVVHAVARPYGRELHVPAFPFISQDRQYGRCAHAVIWMIARYHQRVNQMPERFMSDIVAAAAEDEIERVVPSRGLTDDQVGSALRRLELGAIRYDVRDDSGQLLEQHQVERVVLRYLESSIPVILGTPGHLTALIGAARQHAGSLEVICCDDEHGPYERRPIDLSTGNSGWEILLVPLPGRIYLLGEDMELAARRQLRSLVDHPSASGHTALEDVSLRFKEYVVDTRQYKRKLAERGLPGSAASAHVQVPTARWIWVVEMQDARLAATSTQCVLGEIAVDATSDAADLTFLFANVPGLRASWKRSSADPHVVPDAVAGFVPYETGTALNL